MSLQRIGNRLAVACQGCNVFTKLIQRYRNRWHDAIAEIWLTTISTHSPPHGMPLHICIARPLAEVSARILVERQAARAAHGWVMDTYLMRRPTEASNFFFQQLPVRL